MRALVVLLCCFPFIARAVAPHDSVSVVAKYETTAEGIDFHPRQLILPAALVGLGVYGAIDGTWNNDIRSKTVKWKGDTMIDDILVFAPGASVYLLDWCGIDSKHAFWDKTVIASTAAVLSLGTSSLLKECARVQRPDGDSHRSFPSQHTAVAFAGAELLWQEYRHHSVWYGVAGYGVAACVGFLRIYNDKHWASDVLAGAGIGILSAKAAYWLYPSLRTLYGKREGKTLTVIPFGSRSSFGFSLSADF